ncbi:reverse transcriptase [Senna tora]|uniref:Reverse transcriptase n=1 Tax=Senna tora TaxID=362788 RepID=A0A834WQN8_9FABA|nr:reverse transcriptase [Senna tora]
MDKGKLSEGEVLELEAEEAVAQKGANHQVVGTILSEKVVNKKLVRTLVAKAWGEPAGLTVMDLGVNSFIFSFESEDQALRILNGGPWSIMGSILNTRKWVPGVAIQEINFNLVPFWVQAHGLPLEQISQKNAQRIGRKIGQVILAENPRANDKLVRSFIRVRAFVDVSNPLVTGFWAPRKEGPEVWVFLKYEKLIDMCYNCRVVGHDKKSCKREKLMAVWDPSQPRYGPELSAPPAKSMTAILSEIETQKKKEEPQSERLAGNWKRNPVRMGDGGNVGLQKAEYVNNGEASCQSTDSGGNEAKGGRVKVMSDDLVGPEQEDAGENIQMEWTTDVSNEKERLGYLGTIEQQAHLTRVCISDGKESVGLGPMCMDDLGLEREFIGLKQKVVIVDVNSPPSLRGGKNSTYMHESMALSSEEAHRCKQFILSTNREVIPDKVGMGNKSREVKGQHLNTKGKTISNEIPKYYVELPPEDEEGEKRPSHRAQWITAELAAWLQRRLVLKRGREDAKEQDLQPLLIVKELTDICVRFKPNFLFLSETKARNKKVEILRRKLKFDSMFVVDTVGRSGGLALFWKKNSVVQILDSCSNFIHTAIQTVGQDPPFLLTFIYGHPDFSDRRHLWPIVGNLNLDVNTPWGFIGDFNELLDQSEKDGVRDEGCVHERIDRCLINRAWKFRFPLARLETVPVTESDHTPLILKFSRGPLRSQKVFKFEQFWLDHDQCLPLIEQAWNDGVSSEGLDAICLKISVVSSKLQEWEKSTFKRADKKIMKLQSELGDKYNEASVEGRMEEINGLKRKIALLRKQEEQFWEARAQVKWLRSGDKNTRFFHAMTLQRRSTNRISRIQLDNGEWEIDESQFPEVFSGLYSDLFTSSNPPDPSSLLEAFPVKVTEDMNIALLRRVSMDELKTAVFSLGSLKALGPDGLNGLFYQRSWDFVKEDLLKAVNQFLMGAPLPHHFNETHITLVPKIPNPKSYNITVVQEVFHQLKKKSSRSKDFSLALKIDMNKAYDRMERGFICSVLKAMGFDPKWISLIHNCISSVHYKVKVNGVLSNSISPSRGLRQGDPLSPYLFILAEEVLSFLIFKAMGENLYRGIKLAPSCPNLSHLLFADDAIIFASACTSEVYTLVDILNTFTKFSGQKLNTSKSGVIFEKSTPQAIRANICAILSIQEWDSPGKYLGIPSLWGRSKSNILSWIKEKVVNKISGWKENFLSNAGKEVLIKFVIQAIPSYAMSILRFPKSFCQSISSLVANFWWSNSGKDKGIHWMKWDKLSCNKKMGGLGFKNLYCQKTALLGKQAWRLWKNSDALWAKVLKSVYFPSSDCFGARKKGYSSWCWNSLLDGIDFLKSNLSWVVRNGNCINIWDDFWLPNHSKILFNQPLERNTTVSYLMLPNGRGWDVGKILQLFDRPTAERILSIPIANGDGEDFRVWHFNSDGVYTVKSGYWVAFEVFLPEPETSSSFCLDQALWKWIWSLKVPPKVQNFMWRLCSNALPSMKNLFRRRASPSASCQICGHPEESIEHIFLLCPWTQPIWYGSIFQWIVDDLSVQRIDVWVWQKLKQIREAGGNWKDNQALFASIFWEIWKGRNFFYFEQAKVNPLAVLHSAVEKSVEFVEGGFVSLFPSSPPLTIPNHPSFVHDWNVEGWFRVNVDAAWQDPSSLCATSFLLRDDHGALLTGFSRKF